MSRLPRLADRQVLRLLQRAGFEVHRVRGSHHIMKGRDGKRRLVVPVHGETLAPKTLLSILAAGGLSVEDLESLRRR